MYRLKDTLWAFDLVDFGPDTTRGGKGLNAPMSGVVLGVCTSQDSLRLPNESGWNGFLPASWVVSLHFLVMPPARAAVRAGAQLQPDILMTRGLEHLTPLLVYLRSLEDTSARTTPVRGQGLAWKGT